MTSSIPTTPGQDDLANVGRVEVDGEFASLIFERHLAHSPETVWQAITDPAELSQWYAASATIDGQLGGMVQLITPPAMFVVSGRILTWDPPHVFEHEWKVEARKELPRGEDAVIRWELVSTATGTLLKLTHRRLTRGTATGFAPGTHAILDRFVAYLAGLPLPDWGQRYGAVAGLYRGWQSG